MPGWISAGVAPVSALVLSSPCAAETYRYSKDTLPEEIGFLMLGVFAVLALLALGTVILVVVAKWKIFEKAGQPGWAAIIPIYNFVLVSPNGDG
ncbi:MAG: hypothetical protein ACQETZ_11205 [Candidatus Fermentibacterota bacterium]